jgi:hypothetical protein
MKVGTFTLVFRPCLWPHLFWTHISVFWGHFPRFSFVCSVQYILYGLSCEFSPWHKRVFDSSRKITIMQPNSPGMQCHLWEDRIMKFPSISPDYFITKGWSHSILEMMIFASEDWLRLFLRVVYWRKLRNKCQSYNCRNHCKVRSSFFILFTSPTRYA